MLYDYQVGEVQGALAVALSLHEITRDSKSVNLLE
jgi:hypothetical protein